MTKENQPRAQRFDCQICPHGIKRREAPGCKQWVRRHAGSDGGLSRCPGHSRDAVSDSHDPETAATEELAGWAPYGDPDRLLQMLIERYGQAIKIATLMDNSLRRAAHLRRLRVPAAFLPALAVLLDAVHLSLD